MFNQVNEALEVERYHYKKVKDKQGSNLLTLKPSYTAKSPVPKRRRIKHSIMIRPSRAITRLPTLARTKRAVVT